MIFAFQNIRWFQNSVCMHCKYKGFRLAYGYFPLKWNDLLLFLAIKETSKNGFMHSLKKRVTVHSTKRGLWGKPTYNLSKIILTFEISEMICRLPWYLLHHFLPGNRFPHQSKNSTLILFLQKRPGRIKILSSFNVFCNVKWIPYKYTIDCPLSKG